MCWDQPTPLEAFIGGDADDLQAALADRPLEAADVMLEAWLTRGLIDWSSDHGRQLALHGALFEGSPSRSISAVA